MYCIIFVGLSDLLSCLQELSQVHDGKVQSRHGQRVDWSIFTDLNDSPSTHKNV